MLSFVLVYDEHTSVILKIGNCRKNKNIQNQTVEWTSAESLLEKGHNESTLYVVESNRLEFIVVGIFFCRPDSDKILC